MSKFYRFRYLCRIVGILSGVVALIGIILSASIYSNVGTILLIVGGVALAVDIVLIAIKNRCPFCHKSLRIAPIKGDEFCPYCGCKVDDK